MIKYFYECKPYAKTRNYLNLQHIFTNTFFTLKVGKKMCVLYSHLPVLLGFKGRHVCLGGRINSINCRASCFASVYSICKKRLNSTVSFESTETKSLARQEIEQILPPKQTRATTIALPSVSILLLCLALTS